MYKNEFKRAFSDVSPKSTDEEFTEKIFAAERKKPRRLGGKAAAIPVAAVIAAVSTVTVSAAGGLDLLGAFRSYFSRQPDAAETAELGAAGITECGESFDAGDYTVRLNGLIADSHYAYLSYDVTYRDEKYFDGGAVAAKYREGSPVEFFENITDGRVSIHSSGWGEAVGTDGATVSYVSFFMGEFTPDPATGEYPFSLTCICADDPSFIEGECAILGRFSVNASVPPAKERRVGIGGAILLSDGRTSVLTEAGFGPLSVSLFFDNDFFRSDYARNRAAFTIRLKMKDGTVVDLSDKSSVLSYDEELPPSDLPQPPQNRSAGENLPAETTVIREDAPAETTIRSSAANAAPTEYGTACVLELGYGTAIDPEAVAEIELFGKAFSLTQ